MSIHQFDIQYVENTKIIVIGNDDGDTTHYFWALKNLCSALGVFNWQEVAKAFDPDEKAMVNIDYNIDSEAWHEQALAVDTYPLVMYLAAQRCMTADNFIKWIITVAMPLFGRIICTERLRGREFVLSDEQRRNRTARNRRKKKKRRDKRKLRLIAEMNGHNAVAESNEPVKERITTNV
ncbi:hypothetical protein AGMMS49992_12190 [Clostridia bacterium]|nr:hypothetical protein AGMMS49992_12190 [Clostridia bacterium]